VISLLTWLPLLLLTALAGTSLNRSHGFVPFSYDLDVHIRFLLSLPLLLIAEPFVHKRIRAIVQQFREGELIPKHAYSQLDRAIESAMTLRNSVKIEIFMAIIVYTFGHLIWLNQAALDNSTWYSFFKDGQQHFTSAGLWYAFVSIPIFQFILLRRYFRMFIWTRFLWKVSQIEMNLVPIHPDRAGGLGFLEISVAAFAPLLLAQGTLLSGTIANQIFYEGKSLLDFNLEIFSGMGILLLQVLGPLCVFIPCLTHVKCQGLLKYGALTRRFVKDFEAHWVHHEASSSEEALIRSGDVQFLNDMAGSYQILHEMRSVPFGKAIFWQTILAGSLPLFPLILTLFSFNDLVKRLLGILL
jgi:hypothetical protein